MIKRITVLVFCFIMIGFGLQAQKPLSQQVAATVMGFKLQSLIN